MFNLIYNDLTKYLTIQESVRFQSYFQSRILITISKPLLEHINSFLVMRPRFYMYVNTALRDNCSGANTRHDHV